jgi:alanine-synthesizing transaminase
MLLSDEIYDHITYDGAEFVPLATLVQDTVCVTMSGLSKVYRACGYRVGWAVVSGKLRLAQEFLAALELLASLRLCSNVPGQWAVQTALGGYQSIRELTAPGGRLYESRRVILNAAESHPNLRLVAPQGALYAFLGVEGIPHFDDDVFALDLLERKHVLVAPGISFNVPFNTHFRITNLPDPATMQVVFQRMNELLAEYVQSTPATLQAQRSAYPSGLN